MKPLLKNSFKPPPCLFLSFVALISYPFNLLESVHLVFLCMKHKNILAGRNSLFIVLFKKTCRHDLAKPNSFCE